MQLTGDAALGSEALVAWVKALRQQASAGQVCDTTRFSGERWRLAVRAVTHAGLKAGGGA